MNDEYLATKAERQRMARDWRPGQPVPDIAYSADEDTLWQSVLAKLSALHEEMACEHYRRAAEKVVLPANRVPQLTEVSAQLAPLTGFRLVPAEGVVPAKRFYSTFDDNVFQATQYLRPVSALFHSPEPDVIHELVGHAVMLGDPAFAEIYRCFGRAAKRASSVQALAPVWQLFWFTMETGVVRENGELRAFGAATLSSVAEMESFRYVELREFCIPEMVERKYDDSETQPLVFVVDSVDRMAADLRLFLDRIC